MIIRKSFPEDVPQILGLLAYFHFKDLSKVDGSIDSQFDNIITLRNKVSTLDLKYGFVVEEDGILKGFSHYRPAENGVAETTLMVVNPSCRNQGVGKLLQEARMLEALSQGCRTLYTWCADPTTIDWYENHFGYTYCRQEDVHHTIYSLVHGGQILAMGVQYGDKEYQDQMVIQCDLIEWSKANTIRLYDLDWYVKDYGDPLASITWKSPLIINAAITGSVFSKVDNKYLPVTPEEIVADAEACFKAGARILHLHIRDSKGNPRWEREGYESILPEIRNRCPGVIICVTTTGRIYPDFSDRSDVLNLEGDAKPDMASLTFGSMNFPNTISLNSPEMIVSLASMMKSKGIKPEGEIFEIGMLNYANYLMKKGIVDSPAYFNIILGSLGASPARVCDLEYILSLLPEGSSWAAGGIGKFQLPINLLAISKGGHVRVGLEDNIYLDNSKSELASNAALIGRLVEYSTSIGRPIATTNEARLLLGMRK